MTISRRHVVTGAARLGLVALLPQGCGRSDTADAAAAPTGPLRMGINLSPLNYWTPGSPHLDRVREAGEWRAGSNGSILRMVPFSPQSSQWRISWTGPVARVAVPGATITRRGPGFVQVAIKPTQPAQIGIPVVAYGADLHNPPEISVVPANQPSPLMSGSPWDPRFLEKIEGFSVLRFKDWQSIDDLTVKGLALEECLELSNAMQARPWVCIPHTASDAEVVAFLKVLDKARIRPIVEYSNEVWNWGYRQSKFALAQARAAWGASGHWQQWYGRRCGEIARLARGSGHEIVLGTQPANPNLGKMVWKGVEMSGARNDDFGAWISSFYVTGSLTDVNGPLPALAARNDIAGAIANLLGAPSDPPQVLSVRGLSRQYVAQAAIAREHGLRMIGYEGNAHLNVAQFPKEQHKMLVAFVETLLRDPRAAIVTEANLNAWAAAGGQDACMFNMDSPATPAGFFGIHGTPAWDVVQQRIRQARPPERVPTVR